MRPLKALIPFIVLIPLTGYAQTPKISASECLTPQCQLFDATY